MKTKTFSFTTFLICLLIKITALHAQTGTWTKVTNLAPNSNFGVMLLLTDGTVICHNNVGGSDGTGWDKLTPDYSGSYANGTWTTIASMNYDRHAFSSQVLPSGKVYVAGGEHSSGAGGTHGEVYDPVVNTWTACGALPSGNDQVLDANSTMLPNGNILQALVLGNDYVTTTCSCSYNGDDFCIDNLFYNPITNLYTNAPNSLYGNDETNYLKLPDNSILFVGIGQTGVTNRYISSTNTWVNDAVVPGNLYDLDLESGTAFMLPNGKAIFFGATPYNAIYTPSGNSSPGTWASADSFPKIQGTYMGQPDAPGAMLVNGHILLAVSPISTSFQVYNPPAYFVEYNYITNTFTQIKSTIPGFSGDSIPGIFCQYTTMLDLPDGTVLLSSLSSNQYYIYTPGSGPIPQGKPTINSIIPDGCQNYKITGKLFNGISEGASYGDDWQMASNYPLVRLTNGSNVYYAKTTNWNRIGALQTDSLEDTAVFTLTAIPAGTYSLVVVANGFASNPTLFKVFGITSLTHTNTSSCGIATGTATVTAVGGVSPLTYSWSPGGNTNSVISNLSAGIYTVTVKDNNGCTTSAFATITQPLPLSVSVSAGSANCHGGTGSLTASVNRNTIITRAFSYDSAVQNFTIPNGVTTVTVSVAGAQGGNQTGFSTGGSGASFTGVVPVTAGHILSVVVGQQGVSGSCCHGPGGGGATWVYDSASAIPGGINHNGIPVLSALLAVAAGGGGGAGDGATTSGASGGTDIAGNTTTNSAGSLAGGTGGSGGNSALSTNYIGGGGAGWISNGGSGSAGDYPGNGGKYWGNTAAPYAGGVGNLDINGYGYNGGYGGGGEGSIGGGGGAGYNGGGGSSTSSTSGSGGGGGSYLIGGTANLIGTATATITGNGSAAITYSLPGGTSPYTYSWSPSGGTNITATGLSAGTYTLTVTDASECTATASATVTQPTSLGITISSVTNAACGGGVGNITANAATGGISPYTYSWSPGGRTSLNLTGVSAGTYTITAKDAHGCSVTASATITQSATGVTATTSVPLNVNCNGAATGQAKVIASSGSTPYTYLWSPGGNTTNIAGTLSAGVYTVTVQDKNGCSTTATATVTQPAAIRDSVASFVFPLCYGGVGSATIGVKGGVSPYTFVWTPNVSTTATASNIIARSYVVQVKDAKACTSVVNVTITQPPLIRDSIVRAATVNLTCNGLPIGSATLGVKYGIQPYTYSWTPNVNTTATATGLSVGSYTVTVKDACGNSATAVAIISQSPGVRATAAVANYVTCNGLANGKANVSVAGGTVPYTYSWSPNSNTTYLATGLSAGVYTVTVTDKNGCTGTSKTTVTQPAAIRDSAASTTEPPCNGTTGSVILGVKGGTSPYTYIWSPSVSTTASATGLTARTYVVQVKDAHGCSSSLNVTITQPPAITLTHTLTCNGTNGGTATIGVSSGATPYTYSWSPSGGSGSSASGLSTGTYTVHVTTHAGCTATASITITCTGAEPEGHGNDNEFGSECCPGSENISVYPNPNSGQFTISGIEKGMLIEVYDYTGRKISSSSANNETIQLNVSNQPNGVYLIRIIDKDGTLVSQKKVVKTE